MLLPFLLLLSHLSQIHSVSGGSCACSTVSVPVHVDTLVPVDPTDPFGGLQSNASSLRRVNDTYDIAGVFCQPYGPQNDAIQLLVHGFTYTSEYWSPSVEEFRNYSYVAYSCERGLASLAIDQLGVGLSSRPANASDVQFPTSAAAISQVAQHLKSTPILPGLLPFEKIIGVAHSVGSALLTFDSIVEGAHSPFDGLVLTSLLVVEPNTFFGDPAATITGRDDNPPRWGDLDPAYITTDLRTLFYSPDPTGYSPRMVVFDNFTKDLGSESVALQLPTTSLVNINHYAGPVAKIVGSEDMSFCVGTKRCDNVTALTEAERALWPAARSFEVVVSQGSGHDMNWDFFAQGPFGLMVGFVEKFLAV